VKAVVVEEGLQAVEPLVRLLRKLRDGVLEGVDLVRDRLRQDDADRRKREQQREIGQRNREAARQPRPVQAIDERVEDQRDQRADDKDQHDLACRARSHPEREQRSSQQHQLNALGDHERRRRDDAAGAAAGGCASATRRRSSSSTARTRPAARDHAEDRR
jgi:hypothetical protein